MSPMSEWFKTHRDWTLFVVLMAFCWIVPLSAGGFYLYLATVIAIYAIAALGLQIMVGLAGQLSLGHAAFVGLGAYTTVILEKDLSVSFIPAALAGMVVAGVFGLLMAQLIRLSGIYFKVATLGFGIIVYQLLSNLTWLTGGHVGIRGIPPITIFGEKFTSRQDLFILEMTVLTIVYFLVLRLCRGRIGRAFNAIGQNEVAARSVGVPTDAYRMAVITIGCGIAGLAGSFLPHLMRFLSPESFSWHESLVLLIMITVGGLGSLPGAIIGAAVLVIVPESLRYFAEYKMLVYGLLLVACMMLMPSGISGAIDRAWTRWSDRGAGK
ncbi:MAG: branched-chain amino acid ABC transporter permease [Burkholderiaceae bacterium]|jgi:branched-chain amino acid transport system permease protein